MPRGYSGAITRDLARLWNGGTLTGLTEGQMLERFVSRGDERAFEALVARHGPMVQSVCRSILGDSPDIDDAFQATFLVLVRRAGSIRHRDRLGPWLYGVAYRVATRARVQAGRRRRRERSGVEQLAEAISPPEPDELGPALHEEVNRLPEKYRAPIVLCYLEGLSHDQAAEHLRWPVGTVRGRLARARDLLKARLTRRGLAPSAGLLTAALASPTAQAVVPPALMQSTIQAASALAAGKLTLAAGTVSAGALALSEGVASMMVLSPIKMAAVGVIAGAVTTGAGVVTLLGPGDGPETTPAPVALAQAEPSPQPRVAEDVPPATVPAVPLVEVPAVSSPGLEFNPLGDVPAAVTPDPVDVSDPYAGLGGYLKDVQGYLEEQRREVENAVEQLTRQVATLRAQLQDAESALAQMKRLQAVLSTEPAPPVPVPEDFDPMPSFLPSPPSSRGTITARLEPGGSRSVTPTHVDVPVPPGRCYPVSGTVTYNGEPVERATIVFMSQDQAGRYATGQIVHGRYTLTTFAANDGALPGTYNVSLVAEDVDFSEATKAPHQRIPSKYYHPTTSGLQAEVEAKVNRIDFELVD